MENYQDIEDCQDNEILHDMEILLDSEIIQHMEAEHHKIYVTTISRRKNIFCQVYNLYTYALHEYLIIPN